jgi:hypothetical protein
MRAAFQLATREHAGGIAVDQQGQQHFGMVGGRSPARILFLQRRQVELANGFSYKTR